ncbi:AAA family ATPase [Halarcobacter sp.]|uniref:AAA family ATPase n=1 Tax=Halarcobacter sp. TaxID=2321133 RepID=UPI0029F490AF|nr:AAA family ATPase [Halarcobacter sp.]
MKEDFIETKNYNKMYEGFQNLKRLPRTAPKMGLGFGNFGLGKTFSLEKIAALENAVLLRAVQTWTKSSLLAELCMELNLDASGQAATKYKRVKESLIAEPQIIIIDEIDALLKSTKYEVLETLRDLHDETGIVLFLVGMEEANRKLKKHRHFYSRIVSFVEFQSICFDDIEKLTKLSEITIEDDLIEYFYHKTPNLRQVKVQLIRLEQFCKMNSIKSVNQKIFKSSGAEYGDNK